MAPAMSAFRKVTFAAAVSTCVFNAFVWKTRQGICGINEFKPGSADEMLTETLRPGDILLFQRVWNRYYLPKALSVALYQYLHDSSLDHCGMVVQDAKGDLFVFELSPDGHICTPYRERISQSHCASIVLLPLENSDYQLDSVRYRERLFHQVEQVVSADNQPYEPLEIVKGCVTKLIFENETMSSIVGNDERAKRWQYPYSPSLQIIIDVLQNATDIKMEHQQNTVPLEKITPEDVFQRKMKVTNISNNSSSSVPVGGVTRLGAPAVIRDM